VAAFLAGLGDGGAEAWGQALHSVLDRPVRNRAAERVQTQTALAALLAEWRTLYPMVAEAATAVEARRAWWEGRIAGTSAAAVRAQWMQWGTALTFLATRSEPIGLAELGARCYGNSKALRPGEERRFLLAGLAALDGVEEDAVAPGELLRRYGVCDNPSSLKVTVFGRLRLRKQGRWFDGVEQLHGLGESATLALGNLDGVESMECGGGDGVVYTSENETPFCRLVRERFPGLLVYSEGYPNAAVRRLLRLLPAECCVRHWGDSDLDGLCIATILAQDRPLDLWRCGLAELQRLRSHLQPLLPAQRCRAERWRDAHPDFRFRRELDFTLAHGWLEQESWLEST
jgi:hypothetical protein